MTEFSLRATPLAPLVAALDEARPLGDLDRIVLGIAHDSRAVRCGGAFVALRGERADGHDYIEGAVAAGARTIVVDRTYAAANGPVAGATTVVVPDTRRALSRLAAAFFAYPAASLRVIGITGTNGKTTTTHMIERVLDAGGIATGRIGTLGASFGDARWPLDNTTPLSLELQALLGAMRDRGARAVAMEVSSHALALDRVADVAFAIAVLTNITRDHLDFHASFEEYAAVKRTLFDRAEQAVLCADDTYGVRFAGELRASGGTPITYGFSADAGVRATNVRTGDGGADFAVDGRLFHVNMPGRFNIQNALAALCVARAFGVDDAVSAAALASFAGVPGRMESFASGGVRVFVDYAHTPGALDAVLRTAREAAAREVAVVFGCGGDRDRGKRPEMGRIASELADRVVLTSDNPRGEDPQAIVAEIRAGMRDGGLARVVVDVDRRAAIRCAVADARVGDVVVVAGKGHEAYQIARGATIHFDDRDEVRAALAAREIAVA
ncbi:MAG: UDP-N-acetylmuramoyl-L-alanyl-D-glutamate--2,6-diaminopimelate ligase [Candidatus Eremiobacteraeota bacterium]|nr:UDP-N-acetylmuramoyl-L-alanyl-D-glutamate--2,6-diaminopimelate ligase [Candidatus Eremiobacteraeota bacterium]